MNKWSLLLFSVLGLLLSTTLELNFVDGRLGCCSRSSRTLLSETRLSIYEPYCAYHTFTETNQLISPQRDIPYASRNIELKLKSGSDGRREKFVGRRNSSDERFRVLSNVVFDLKDSTLSNARDRKALREINGLKLQRTLNFFRDNFRESHVDRSRSRNNDFFGNKMERNSLERGINIKEELSEIWNNRFRHIDGPVSSNLKDRKRERFNRRTFVIRTNIIPNTRENIDEIRLRFIEKKEVKRDVEGSNLDINTKQRLFRDIRLTSDLSKNSDRRFKKDERIMQLPSKIDILRNRNIQDYRRLSVREDSIEKKYERASLTDVRRNTDMYGTVNVYRRSYDKDIFEEILERMNSKNVVKKIQNKKFTQLDKSSRSRTIQRENERSGNRIREDERQMNNGFETRLFEKRYSTRRLPRQNSNINRLHEIRQARFYNDINIEDGLTDHSNVFIERTKRASDQSRNREIRENKREIRISEEYMAERITPSKTNCLIEKRAVSSNINKRRSETIRRSVLERREKDSSRYRLDHESENNFDQRIRQIGNSYNEDRLHEVRNTQKSMIRGKNMNNALGQEIKIIRQIYDDDNVSQGLLVRHDNNKKLVRRLEHEHLRSTVKRASQIRINQRDNQNKMHIRAMNLIENRIQADPTFNGRLATNANTNNEIEKQRARTYNEKSDREFFRNSLVREAELDFDESRIRQGRDKHEYRREYRSNVERTVGLGLSRIDRNRNNVVESGLVSFGKNRIYGTIRSVRNVLTRRENYEVRHWLTHENERILDQSRTRDLLERREDDLSKERLARRNVAPRNSMNNVVLNKNRRSYNDENDSQVSTNPKDIFNRSEKERSAVIKSSYYLRMIQREHENRIRNDYTQPIHIQESSPRRERCAKRCLAGQDSEINRSVEDRRAGIIFRSTKDNLNTLRIVRSVDESRIGQLRDSREYRLKEKLNAERVLEQNNNKIIEKRESRIRHEIDVNENQKTKRTQILLQIREKDVPSLIRLNERGFEQNGNGIVRNRREFTRIEDHGRNVPVAEMQIVGLRNKKSSIRDTHNKLITRYIATEVEVHDSVETQHQRRTERVIRIARHTVIINNRDLQARSEKQWDVNRKIEYVRNYNGLESGAHRENKENVRTSDGDNNRGRDAQDRARDIRSSNGLRVSKTVSRITKTRRTNEEEREMRSAFSKIRYVPIEHKTQSDNLILEIKLQYIFYMLQGLYILGLFTKFTINSDGIQKRTRLSNWFPLFSTLKVH